MQLLPTLLFKRCPAMIEWSLCKQKQEHNPLQRPAEEVYLGYESEQKFYSWSVAHWVLLSDNKTCTVLGKYHTTMKGHHLVDPLSLGKIEVIWCIFEVKGHQV